MEQKTAPELPGNGNGNGNGELVIGAAGGVRLGKVQRRFRGQPLLSPDGMAWVTRAFPALERHSPRGDYIKETDVYLTSEVHEAYSRTSSLVIHAAASLPFPEFTAQNAGVRKAFLVALFGQYPTETERNLIDSLLHPDDM
jgi:hypothetical protein